MRESIKKQLSRLRYADISGLDKATGICNIPKYSKAIFEAGKCYLVQLPKHLVGNPDSLEAKNWNNGTAPRAEVLKVYVNKLLGGMMQVDSIAYDIENGRDTAIMWSGWLPIEDLHQIACI